MPDDLPPDLERLTTLRVWTAMCLERIDRRIAYVQKRQAEEEHGRRNRPQPADWVVELSRATGEPLQVHDGECGMKGKRHRAVSRDEARQLLTVDTVPACPFCHPDTQLRIIGDLAARRDRPGRASNDRAIPPVILPTGQLVMTA
ncbi:DUF6233 domain-containing protein [Streptomyces sp. NPDC101455]|uniref:DUF6233 domain-containing protein n=1 Tax=Streptomyces sp. NPDC101455 TaxID=3366142 RepID=UPI0038195380